MSQIEESNHSVFERFAEPLDSLIAENPFLRSCPEISDREWVHLGLKRILGDESSGRGFLQRLFLSCGVKVSTSLFFENLGSSRRLSFLKHLLKSLLPVVAQCRGKLDPLAAYSDLDGFQVYAGDGTKLKPSTHEDSIDDQKIVPQHFFTLNLRSHGMGHLSLAETGGGRHGEHDMHALKRKNHMTLRQGIGKGEKILYVWDRAVLDFLQWEEWKRKAIYIVSRSKKNLKLSKVEGLDYDKEDPVNHGVICDELVKTGADTIVRRVIYRCPLSSKTYSFLTNLHKRVRPGIIAMIYKIRWDIEKAFDQVKNRMGEKKAWTKSNEGKEAQAIFACLAHNLMLLMDDELVEKHDAKVERDTKRRKERLEYSVRNSKITKDMVPSWLFDLQRVTQKPLLLWRWMRSYLFSEALWIEAVGRYRQSCEVYG